MAEMKERPAIVTTDRAASLIESVNLTKRFDLDGRDLQVLKDVTVSIEEGRFVCLLGPSGCGKSTFLRCIAGLERPSGGTLRLDGQPIEGPGPDRGMVFQDYALLPWCTVTQNIQFGLRLRHNRHLLNERSLAEITHDLIELTDLGGFENAYPHQISGGMRQRVGLARALSLSPRVLLMDEPFAALDAITRESLQRQFLDIWARTGKTVVFVTHSVDEAAFLGDEVHIFGTRPASIRRSLKIDLPRPRFTSSLEFVRIVAELKESISDR
jgi:NitT/TauT family transport system ATP-binding protein